MKNKSVRSLSFSADEEDVSCLKKETKIFIEKIKRQIKKRKVDVEVFVGGSFAKGTLAKQENYDVDIFVRFNKSYKNISDLLEKILKGTKEKFERVHGSRDYFKVEKIKKLTFEIVPVRKIKSAKEANNVTDLSYFHVNYVKKKLSKKMGQEVAMAKQFCKAQRVYGAESYINGFSGYALECLIIYYKTLNKMLKGLLKVKGKLVIDSAGHYKRKENVFVEINESKTRGPVILVDPTFKERNVLAALNKETFEKFQDAGRKFLKNPSEKFFVFEKVDIEKMKSKKGEFVHIILETDRQEGDIAGTKLKKVSRFFVRELEKGFDILDREFVYSGGKKSDFYLLVKSRGEIMKRGPSVSMKKNVKRFKSRNKKVFSKGGVLYAKVKVPSIGEFLRGLIGKDKGKIKEMGVIKSSVRD